MSIIFHKYCTRSSYQKSQEDSFSLKPQAEAKKVAGSCFSWVEIAQQVWNEIMNFLRSVSQRSLAFQSVGESEKLRTREQSDGGGPPAVALLARSQFLAFPDRLERQATLANGAKKIHYFVSDLLSYLHPAKTTPRDFLSFCLRLQRKGVFLTFLIRRSRAVFVENNWHECHFFLSLYLTLLKEHNFKDRFLFL